MPNENVVSRMSAHCNKAEINQKTRQKLTPMPLPPEELLIWIAHASRGGKKCSFGSPVTSKVYFENDKRLFSTYCKYVAKLKIRPGCSKLTTSLVNVSLKFQNVNT